MAMKRAYPLFALASGSLLLMLSACTRSSLPDTERTCDSWSRRDGEPEMDRSVFAALALPGGGVMALEKRELVLGGRWSGIRKHDPDGRVAWEMTLGDDGVVSDGLTRDATGGVLVAGGIGGKGTVLGTELTCPGQDTCGFILKIDDAGTVQRTILLPGGFLMNTPAVTSDGRIAVEGWFYDTIDLGCGALTAVEGDHTNRFVALLSPSGECLWSRAIVSPKLNGWTQDHLAVDDAGEVALTIPLWMSSGAEAIDLGEGPVPFDTEKGSAIAVAKYAPNGDLALAKVVTSTSANPSMTVLAPNVALTRAGEVILSATHKGATDFGDGPQGSPELVRQAVTKLSATGEVLWTRDIAVGALVEVGVGPWPFTLALAPDGAVVLAGVNALGMKILDDPTPKDALYVITYEPDGDVASTQAFPLTGRAGVPALDASQGDTLLLAGAFAGTLDIGPSPLVSEGESDAFVATICR
ncbi:Hypothetical protein A7982_09920 [Minicystis rosea]|nr:Hypothetical protein A7982_09920 [Minicystis rosea]